MYPVSALSLSFFLIDCWWGVGWCGAAAVCVLANKTIGPKRPTLELMIFSIITFIFFRDLSLALLAVSMGEVVHHLALSRIANDYHLHIWMSVQEVSSIGMIHHQDDDGVWTRTIISQTTPKEHSGLW